MDGMWNAILDNVVQGSLIVKAMPEQNLEEGSQLSSSLDMGILG